MGRPACEMRLGSAHPSPAHPGWDMSSVGVGRAGFFVVRGGRSGRAALVERGRVEALEGLRQQRPGPGIDALVLAVDPLEGP